MRTRVRRAWRVDLQACFITLRHDYRITASTRLEYPATNFILLSSCEGCRQCAPEYAGSGDGGSYPIGGERIEGGMRHRLSPKPFEDVRNAALR